jgi:hypothetical protein
MRRSILLLSIVSMQVFMGVYVYGSEGLRIGVQDIFKDLDNDQEMTVTEVSKKLHAVTQIEEAKETLHQTNGGKSNTSELVLDVNSVQADETRVCNNSNCGVTFTPTQNLRFILTILDTTVTSTVPTV